MRILTGTSGWSYPAWRGKFYPAGLPASAMLAAYSGRLPTVEVNATAHRMPPPALLAGWRAQARPGFVFALKAPKWITHQLRLRRAGGAMARFHAAARELGDGLGPVLYQLPPELAKDLPLLEDFLRLLPSGRRAAFQLHGDWLASDVLDALARRGAALCVVDADEGSDPLVATADFGYLRLRRLDYDAAALERWAERVASQRWSDAFVYFRHEDRALGPDFARRFAELCARRSGGDRPTDPVA